MYLSVKDVLRVARFLDMDEEEFRQRYVYSTKHRIRLRKPRGRECPFLLEDKGCQVHPVKPTQCRVFPLWPELIEDKRELSQTSRWCPGIGKGNVVSVEELEASAREMRRAYPHMY